jgi:hypothetical protein
MAVNVEIGATSWEGILNCLPCFLQWRGVDVALKELINGGLPSPDTLLAIIDPFEEVCEVLGSYDELIGPNTQKKLESQVLLLSPKPVGSKLSFLRSLIKYFNFLRLRS